MKNKIKNTDMKNKTKKQLPWTRFVLAENTVQHR